MKTILLVEDDLFFSDLISTVLNQYKILVASNAIEAIDLIDENKIDLIILDLLMPAATGFGFLQEVISYDDLNKIPIIIYSSVASELKLELFAQSSVVAILDKTKINYQDLVEKVKRHLDD